MITAGIVAEYNPFHAGHAHHIAETRRLLGADAAIVCVMSGNWVQRGDCAVFDKWTRARMALEGGADLVLELPTVWALSSAEGFARGAVSVLAAAGAVSHLSFGSECGDVSALSRLALCLDSPACAAALRRYLDAGLPFARCRQLAAEELLGAELAGLLAQPNNNLGVEYLRALNTLDGAPVPVTVPRAGAGHDGGDHPEFPSASFLRERLRRQGGECRAGRLGPPGSAENPDGAPWSSQVSPMGPAGDGRSPPETIAPTRCKIDFCSENVASLAHCQRAVLARLRTMTAADWAELPDSGAAEGLPRRLERAGRDCTSLDDLYTLAKTKRYAHARLRRLALWAFLGIRRADVPEQPPCLRVLGLNGRGREVLREMKARAAVPILTKPARADRLGAEARRLFALEERCTDLYALCFRTPRPAGWEKRSSPAVL